MIILVVGVISIGGMDNRASLAYRSWDGSDLYWLDMTSNFSKAIRFPPTIVPFVEGWKLTFAFAHLRARTDYYRPLSQMEVYSEQAECGRWSFDYRYLLCKQQEWVEDRTAPSGQLYFAVDSLDPTQPHVIIEGNFYGLNALWMPASHTLLIATMLDTGGTTLYTYDLDTQQLRLIHHFSESIALVDWISGQEQVLIELDYPEGTPDEYAVLTLETNAIRLLDDRNHDFVRLSDPRPSPNGQSLLFENVISLTNHSIDSSIYQLHLDDWRYERVVEQGTINSQTWSPDGQHVLYALREFMLTPPPNQGYRDSLYVYNTETSETRLFCQYCTSGFWISDTEIVYRKTLFGGDDLNVVPYRGRIYSDAPHTLVRTDEDFDGILLNPSP